MTIVGVPCAGGTKRIGRGRGRCSDAAPSPPPYPSGHPTHPHSSRLERAARIVGTECLQWESEWEIIGKLLLDGFC